MWYNGFKIHRERVLFPIQIIKFGVMCNKAKGSEQTGLIGAFTKHGVLKSTMSLIVG